MPNKDGTGPKGQGQKDGHVKGKGKGNSLLNRLHFLKKTGGLGIKTGLSVDQSLINGIGCQF